MHIQVDPGPHRKQQTVQRCGDESSVRAAVPQVRGGERWGAVGDFDGLAGEMMLIRYDGDTSKAMIAMMYQHG